jgi:AbrB family looped-hinge helix DNA binding protein
VVKVEITSVDKAGRIVLPKETRGRLGINEKTKLLLAEVKGDTIILKKISVQEMAKQLEVDLKNVDLMSLFKKVRDETNEKVKRAYPEIFI